MYLCINMIIVMIIIIIMKIIYVVLMQSSSKRFDIQLLPRQAKFHDKTISTSREVYSASYLERRINTRIQAILSLSDIRYPNLPEWTRKIAVSGFPKDITPWPGQDSNPGPSDPDPDVLNTQPQGPQLVIRE